MVQNHKVNRDDGGEEGGVLKERGDIMHCFVVFFEANHDVGKGD